MLAHMFGFTLTGPVLLGLPKSFGGLYSCAGTGKQKYKYGRQNPFIRLLLMVRVPRAAEITELIGPVTGTATFWSLGILPCLRGYLHASQE